MTLFPGVDALVSNEATRTLPVYRQEDQTEEPDSHPSFAESTSPGLSRWTKAEQGRKDVTS
jgi:hypothetical protein